jgi:hypothetical protein
VLSDFFAHESGLLSVVIMGMVLGNKKAKALKDILYFKESLSVLLISILFILLAAHININDLFLLYRWETLILFAIVIFVLRPIGVLLSTYNSGLKINEKLFISWVGPRGIVAAGIASLFGLKLTMQGEPGAEYITPLVFMVVLGTVLLNATTARLFARLLGVFLKTSDAILIAGASSFSRLIATYLKDNNRRVILIDSNPKSIEKARALGLEAIEGNVYSDDLVDNVELNDVGFLLALTASASVNRFVLEKFSSIYGEHGAFRLISTEEMLEGEHKPDINLFTRHDDYINLSEVVRDYPAINEIEIKSKEHFKSLLKQINFEKHAIPVFIKDKKGEIHIIATLNDDEKFAKGNILMYVGKKMM